jgi:hypothetical protein
MYPFPTPGAIPFLKPRQNCRLPVTATLDGNVATSAAVFLFAPYGLILIICAGINFPQGIYSVYWSDTCFSFSFSRFFMVGFANRLLTFAGESSMKPLSTIIFLTAVLVAHAGHTTADTNSAGIFKSVSGRSFSSARGAHSRLQQT